MSLDYFIKIIKLGRFHFVFGGFLLFLFGALLAILSGASFDMQRFFFGYLIVFMAHLSVSYSNVCFDTEVDKHTIPSIFSGGTKILVESPELVAHSRMIAIFLILMSLLITVFVIYVFSFPSYMFFHFPSFLLPL
jgi:1,4-dihydroxy-2-naphthoate octaprenyltransferase